MFYKFVFIKHITLFIIVKVYYCESLLLLKRDVN